MDNEIKWLNKKFEDITGGFTKTVEIRERRDTVRLDGLDRIRELLTESLESMKAGDYQTTKEILKEARETTKCGGCRQLIQRTEADLNYVDNLCKLEEEDCKIGAENIIKKIEYIKDDYLGSE